MFVLLYYMDWLPTVFAVAAIVVTIIASVDGFASPSKCQKDILSVQGAANSNTSNSEINNNDDDGSVPVTPCNRICRYNAKHFGGEVCIGCFRETYEISSWGSMDATEKY